VSGSFPITDAVARKLCDSVNKEWVPARRAMKLFHEGILRSAAGANTNEPRDLTSTKTSKRKD
jgi:phage terminase small subunit